MHLVDRETWRAVEGAGMGECIPLPAEGNFWRPHPRNFLKSNLKMVTSGSISMNEISENCISGSIWPILTN